MTPGLPFTVNEYNFKNNRFEILKRIMVIKGITSTFKEHILEHNSRYNYPMIKASLYEYNMLIPIISDH